LELSPEQWPQVLAPESRQAIYRKISDSGWRYLTLDLQGYQSGSMNLRQAI